MHDVISRIVMSSSKQKINCQNMTRAYEYETISSFVSLNYCFSSSFMICYHDFFIFLLLLTKNSLLYTFYITKSVLHF
jgi:hypothetical protein